MTNTLLQQPKNFDSKIELHCPKDIIDRIDFKKVTKHLNNQGRLSFKIKHHTLQTNFILLLNYFSTRLPFVTDNRHVNLKSKDLKRICSDKYYRICIELMQNHKILYVKHMQGKETYCKDQYSKSYRWNMSLRQFSKMTDIYTHVVTDYRTKNKILNNLDALQCFEYSKLLLVKQKRKISKYKKPKKFGKSNKSLMNYLCNSRFVTKWTERYVYITPTRLKSINNRKKYGLQKMLCVKYGIALKLSYYKKISFEQMQVLSKKLEEKNLYIMKSGQTILHKLDQSARMMFGSCFTVDNIFRIY